MPTQINISGLMDSANMCKLGKRRSLQEVLSLYTVGVCKHDMDGLGFAGLPRGCKLKTFWKSCGIKSMNRVRNEHE